MTDPTITIAGLEARIKCLVAALRSANTGRAEAATLDSAACGYNAQLRTERDALAAQLAEVRAELARREAADLSRDASESINADQFASLRAELIQSRADLASERAHLAACRTRIAGLEQAADERSREDKDRGARMDAIRAALGAHPFASDDHIADRIRALTARVAELEARPVNARAALISVLTATKHGPGGRGGPGDCDADCVKCEAERALASLGAPPTSPPAARPVFAGVSMDDLLAVFFAGWDKPADNETRSAAGLRAVLARLDATLVAPVDPEAFAKSFLGDKAWSHTVGPSWDDLNSNGRATARDTARRTLTAAGIPVTPEVRK